MKSGYRLSWRSQGGMCKNKSYKTCESLRLFKCLQKGYQKNHLMISNKCFFAFIETLNTWNEPQKLQIFPHKLSRTSSCTPSLLLYKL